ncbi:hypothetical protein FRC00_005811 [Tulasnella sp. 408]|nr:hypothetical protein FRC00_005811 [Tulasnella sp. 408]
MSNLNVNWSPADASPAAPQASQQEGDLGYRYADDMPEGSASDAEKQVLITALVNWMRKASWFAGTIGQRLRVVRVDTSCSPDGNQKKKTAEVECEVAVEEDMINAFGTLHGGCSGFLIDVCTTLPLIVLSDEKWAVAGSTLQIKSSSVAVGGRSATARCEIWDKKRQALIASGTNIKMSHTGLALNKL